MKKTLIKKIVYCFLIIIILVLVSSLVSSAKTAVMNSYSQEDIIRIVSQVNVYDNYINEYAKKYDVPPNIIKAVIGVETEGILNYAQPYNYANAIGLMQIVPFYTSGKSLHYDTCLNVGCMGVKVDDSLPLEEKKKLIENEFISPKQSICCGTYILKAYNVGDVTFAPEDSCSVIRVPVTYNGWEAAIRKYNGLGCPPNSDHAYYVERVMQLKSAFDQLETQGVTSHGFLRFTPSFMISPPLFIDIYEKLPTLIKDIQSENTLAGVNQKLDNFASQNNVEFSTYCEEPDINLVNKIYDNVVNAVLFEKRCLYPVADEFAFAGEMQDQKLLFEFNFASKILTMKNNLVGELYREFEVVMPNNFYLGFNNFDITQDSSHMLKYSTTDFVRLNNKLSEIQNIYFVNNYANDASEFIFHQNINNEDKYYNTLGEKIDIASLNLALCDSSLPNYKLKYFTCLDTKQKEEIYDWATNKWKESDEIVKIKFAFALPKSNT